MEVIHRRSMSTAVIDTGGIGFGGNGGNGGNGGGGGDSGNGGGGDNSGNNKRSCSKNTPCSEAREHHFVGEMRAQKALLRRALVHTQIHTQVRPE